ncbi:hypothetical protein BJ742DRAFT_798232 [Cladochytrium replicatum]|nr:hypothetical protein BJ742DRAFT_798232 [Cladochytrium replicatum]
MNGGQGLWRRVVHTARSPLFGRSSHAFGRVSARQSNVSSTRILSTLAAGAAVATVIWTSIPVDYEEEGLTSTVHCDSPDSAWKKKTVGNYENKLRFFSHPYKVFQHFASVKKDGVRYMTAQDFIRSLIPYREHSQGSRSKRVPSAEQFFSLADMDGDGLISYSEYLIFLTLLGTPEYQWKVSFKLFDVNGDGLISKDEFERIMATNTQSLGIGAREGPREHKYKPGETGLFRLFFGADGKQTITQEQFTDFMHRLQLEVLKLEFYQYGVDDKETISLRDFGYAVISYAKGDAVPTYLKALSTYADEGERISFSQFYDFDRMVHTRLQDIEMAYRIYKSTTRHPGFDRTDFARIVRAVTKVELTPGQVDLLFHMFDTSKDGHLDSEEFHRALKGRDRRGLDFPRDTGLFQWMGRVYKCAKEA